MVHFWIDDVRIKKLAEDTLKRAFIGEFKKVHEKYSDRRAGDLFDFYAQYITHVHLEDKLDPRTIGRTITDTRVEDEEWRPAKGEIVLFLPVSMRGKFTDDEIIGIIAHEINSYPLSAIALANPLAIARACRPESLTGSYFSD